MQLIDKTKFDAAILDLSNTFKDIVADIEAEKYKTTQNNYGRYLPLIALGKDKTSMKIIAFALIKAGANNNGVNSALNLSI